MKPPMISTTVDSSHKTLKLPLYSESTELADIVQSQTDEAQTDATGVAEVTDVEIPEFSAVR